MLAKFCAIKALLQLIQNTYRLNIHQTAETNKLDNIQRLSPLSTFAMND
ncbi:hypothetical protein IVY21_18810 [Salmonella enterica subsp. enterica serovar Worthington]|nr:hypothetical protein [Salmonella enterica subsp. enterica serovar Worthington]